MPKSKELQVLQPALEEAVRQLLRTVERLDVSAAL